MDIQDVFAKLKARMLAGMVFHDEMARYFDFLNLLEYRDNHRKHYFEETENYHSLCEYYSHHYNKLIPNDPMERPSVIPDSWYMYTRQEVDSGTKKNAVKAAVRKWAEWESETKDIFEEMCGELLNNGEIAAYQFVSGFVKDVDREVVCATDKHIMLESVGYDLSFIQ